MHPLTKQHKMVRWYDPALLLRAGIRAVVTTVIGGISDNREVLAALNPVDANARHGVYDYSGEETSGDFWVDYAADTGDGWDASYAVAHALTRAELPSGDNPTRRGRILILGGDQVYPDPYDHGYDERLIAPFAAACANAGEFDADIFAIPGNHDWYDGLHEFSDLFASAGRSHRREDGKIAHWNSRQTRSYFALKLPHKWWCIGIDVALDGRLNATQMDYFRAIADHEIAAGDRIILCSDTPRWADGGNNNPDINLSILSDLFARQGAEIAVIIVGDIHHYSHYAPLAGGPQLITCGGGGAFLHPTHRLPETTQLKQPGKADLDYRLNAASPSKAMSRRLTYRNLLFPVLNWDFAIFVGLAYTMLAWILDTGSHIDGVSLPMAFHQMILGKAGLGHVIERTGNLLLHSPAFTLSALAFSAALTAFNICHSRVEKILLGLGHSLAQFVNFIAVYCLSVEVIGLASTYSGQQLYSIPLFMLVMFAFSAVAGGLLFGIFLLISLNLFGSQWTNAFSSLRIADHKSFLRMRIAADGELTLYPFKIDKVGPPATPPTPISAPIMIGAKRQGNLH